VGGERGLVNVVTRTNYMLWHTVVVVVVVVLVKGSQLLGIEHMIALAVFFFCSPFETLQIF
jgi:hypothetical protein